MNLNGWTLQSNSTTQFLIKVVTVSLTIMQRGFVRSAAFVICGVRSGAADCPIHTFLLPVSVNVSVLPFSSSLKTDCVSCLPVSLTNWYTTNPSSLYWAVNLNSGPFTSFNMTGIDKSYFNVVFTSLSGTAPGLLTSTVFLNVICTSVPRVLIFRYSFNFT